MTENNVMSLEERLAKLDNLTMGVVGVNLDKERKYEYFDGAAEIYFDRAGATIPIRNTIAKTKFAYQNLFNEIQQVYGATIADINIGDLFEHRYKPLVADALEENEMADFNDQIEKHKDMKYGEIVTKVAQASEAYESETGAYSDEEKEQARETIEQYKEIFGYLQRFQYAEMSREKSKAIDKSNIIYIRKRSEEREQALNQAA